MKSISELTGISEEDIKRANPGIFGEGKINKFNAGDMVNLPDTKNIQSFKEAAAKLGSTEYDYYAENKMFAAETYKCNLFANDVITDVYGDFPKRDGWRSKVKSYLGIKEQGPVSARELATRSDLPGMTKVPQSNARIGDIAAFDMISIGATGHTGIYAGNVTINGNKPEDGSFGLIGAGKHTVNHQSSTSWTGSFRHRSTGFQRVDP